jgi:hypothetical protein
VKVAIRTASDSDGKFISKRCYWWCIGCDEQHLWQIEAANGPTWDWNGDTEKPTVTPSILTDGSRPDQRCHVFIKDGTIQYLEDCWHSLAGQTVLMIDVPDWLAK